MRITRALAAMASGLLLLTGCATMNPVSTATDEAQALAGIYSQKVDWTSCEGKTKCGDVVVPVDWSKPQRETFKLAVAYLPAGNAEPMGSILVNPGGPGASGVDFVQGASEQLGTKELLKNYNIVGFDPRGVSRSAPVKCLDAKATDEYLYGDNGFEIGSPEDLADMRKTVKKFAEACVQNSTSVLGFVDTVSAARDMDVIRAVMGDEQLNYLGFSYGTFLGTTYAALFPEKVGHLVLDGAIDPSVSDAMQSENQLKGFDQALRNYLASCLSSSDCPFSGTVDQAMEKIRTLFLSIEKKQLETDLDRKLTIGAAITGLIMTLYSEDYWQYASQAFNEALKGDGTTFLRLADFYNDRGEDGRYATNMMEANVAISCLDSRQPSDEASMKAQNARVLKLSKFFGRYWQNGAIGCEQWPFPIAERPASYAASGSKPILVIGTTGDPATPYEQAVSLANKVLENGVMITYNGEGHTAYGRSNSCISNTVDDFFIKNVVPSEDPNC